MSLGTRAVLRIVEPGAIEICARCEQAIKFHAVKKPRRVIANVYRGARWDRLETFHENCYLDAGEPYGLADQSKLPKKLIGSAS